MIPKKIKQKVAEGETHWLKRRSFAQKAAKIIKKHFGKLVGLKLLDAGCAEGREVLELTKVGINAEGIDYNKDLILKGKKYFPGIKIKYGNVEKLPYKNKTFDVVLCISTLFYTNPEKSLPEIERVLKKGGIGIITLDTKIIDLEKNKKIHKMDVPKALKLLTNSEIISKEYKQRVDRTPFRHKHCYYEIVFRKIK
ncbi:hypothetical protein DRJ17_02275 [Candidatus Woesearchaeota archaeon]|nr:MAG: hypothetical protein DRJ17_02275 [Candidatus Woesearchaeota archaeon]